ncbi:MAG: TolC family protein [Opitutaceae bacterium]
MKVFRCPPSLRLLAALLLTAAILRAQSAPPETAPVSLTALVAEITAANPELRFYEEEIAAARAGTRAAGSFSDPEVSLDLGRKRVKDAAGSFGGSGAAWSVSVTQTFEWPGRLALRKAIANRNVELAELGFNRFKHALTARARVLAYTLHTANAEAAARIRSHFDARSSSRSHGSNGDDGDAAPSPGSSEFPRRGRRGSIGSSTSSAISPFAGQRGCACQTALGVPIQTARASALRRLHAVEVRLLALLGVSVLLIGCGRKPSAHDGPNHAAHAGHQTVDAAVTFKEGRGLSLKPEVVNALGLTTAEVEERAIGAEMTLLVQVFATEPRVLASARVPVDEAEALEKRKFTGATVVRIDRSAAAATRLVDVIFALDRRPRPAPGDFVELTLSAEPVQALSIPRSALLDSAAGVFVYVANGAHFLRTAVKIGAGSSRFVEIKDGLYAGDVVVTASVEQLWLTELRLTKGGGHSH